MKIKQEKIIKRLDKILKIYDTKVEMLNEMHQLGASRHICMITELLLLNKSYKSIQKTLLFTDNAFEILIEELNTFFINYKQLRKRYKKLRGF